MRFQGSLLILASGILGMPLEAQTSQRETSFVADALSWYSVWMRSDPSAASTQVCRGEHRADAIFFRCDPLEAVVSVTVDKTGECEIINMSPKAFDSDGLTMRNFPHTGGAEPTPLGSQCPELPDRQGPFEITVTMRPRKVNEELSAAAPETVSKYLEAVSSKSCRLWFPKIMVGDPFYHVYEECDGKVIVSEFEIQAGRLAESAHWYYGESRGLPAGTEERLRRSDLWWRIE
jgi:hypothetical protein